MAIGLGVSLAPLASVFSKKYALLFLRKRNGTPPYISRRYGFVTKYVFFLVDKKAPKEKNDSTGDNSYKYQQRIFLMHMHS